MRLRNKKTGEIIVCDGITESLDYPNHYVLKNGWEDYEETKNYWYIAENGDVEEDDDIGKNLDVSCKEFGNYFATKEEAEQTVEKLKAWKRLKDNGFKFRGIKENWVGRGENPLNYMRTDRTIHFNKQEDNDWLDENWNDLLLLFGGEDE